MPAYADLHLHSTASDGTLPPRQVMQRLAEEGVRAAALTDHDTVAGIADARDEAGRLGIEFVTGIELSAGDGSREIHILGYRFDPEHEALAEHREQTFSIRKRRLLAMVERLGELGLDLDLDDVLGHVGDGMPGRPHVARAMVDAGHVTDTGEAFQRYLADGGRAFVPKPVFHARDAIRLIHRAGGVAVLAHPGHAFNDRDIAALARLGLDGIEVSHPSHPPELEAYYRTVAQRFELISTGGSDYHGARDEQEGPRPGEYGMTHAMLERLHDRARTYSRPNSDPCPAP